MDGLSFIPLATRRALGWKESEDFEVVETLNGDKALAPDLFIYLFIFLDLLGGP